MDSWSFRVLCRPFLASPPLARCPAFAGAASHAAISSPVLYYAHISSRPHGHRRNRRQLVARKGAASPASPQTTTGQTSRMANANAHLCAATLAALSPSLQRDRYSVCRKTRTSSSISHPVPQFATLVLFHERLGERLTSFVIVAGPPHCSVAPNSMMCSIGRALCETHFASSV